MEKQKLLSRVVTASILAVAIASTALASVTHGQTAFDAGNYTQAANEFRQEARQGNAQAQYALAAMYEIGLGVPLNRNEAYRYYERAAKSGHPEAQYMLCQMYAVGYYGDTVLVKADERKADSWAYKAAQQGQVDAQRYLALVRDAPEWTEKLAEAGDRDAQFKLSYWYEQGIGYAADKSLALKWAEKAAERGHATSQNNLAYRYQYGDAVARDHEKALYWRKQLAEQGRAEDVVAWIKLALGDTRTLEKVAKEGDAAAQFALAYDYLHDRARTPENNRQGMRWLEQAAQQGLAYAQFELATKYFLGELVPKDAVSDFQLTKRAAEQGLPAAQSHLGFLYSLGRGTEKNQAEAFYWYLAAAESGYKNAFIDLGKILNSGKGLAPLLAKGDANAQYVLGFIYDHGNELNTARQGSLAAYWYSRAAKQGHARAKERLSKIAVVDQ